MVTILRGRAAQPVRPGFMIRDVLSGIRPLIIPGAVKGEVIEQSATEACMTELHFTYKVLIDRENQTRPKHMQLRGMTTESFAKLFRFARYMGLLEFIRDEDMISPPPGLPLLQIVDRTGITESKRKIYKLSDLGVAEEVAWGDLRKAWQEKWEMPRKLEIPPELPPEVPPTVPPEEVVAPPVPKPPRKPGVPPEVPTEIPKVKFAERPSVREFKKLLRHLETLRLIGAEEPEVRREIGRNLEHVPGDWLVNLEDMIEITKMPKTLEKYRIWMDAMMPLYEALADRDLDKAIAILEALT